MSLYHKSIKISFHSLVCQTLFQSIFFFVQQKAGIITFMFNKPCNQSEKTKEVEALHYFLPVFFGFFSVLPKKKKKNIILLQFYQPRKEVEEEEQLSYEIWKLSWHGILLCFLETNFLLQLHFSVRWRKKAKYRLHHRYIITIAHRS